MSFVKAACCQVPASGRCSHPFAVALCEVVVDGDEVDRFACQGIEIERHDGCKGFSFAGLHFSDGAMVHGDGADHLHIVRNHVPFLIIAGNMDFGADEAAAAFLTTA